MINLQTRELILKWKKEKKTQQEIAELVGCNQSAVSRFLTKHSKTGSIKNLPRSGGPTLLTKENLKELKCEFKKKAKEANKKFCSVDTKEFSRIIEEKTKK